MPTVVHKLIGRAMNTLSCKDLNLILAHNGSITMRLFFNVLSWPHQYKTTPSYDLIKSILIQKHDMEITYVNVANIRAA